MTIKTFPNMAFKFFSRFVENDLSPEDQEAKNNYLDKIKVKHNKKTPIRDLTFVVLDTETTGLDISKDKILSIAALKVHNYTMHLEDRMEAFVRQDHYKVEDSVKIHGIINRHAVDGWSEKEMLIAFLDFVGNAVIIGHHISFDLAMLNRALYKHFGIRLKNKSLDTASMYQRLQNPHNTSGKPISLDDLCSEFNVPLGKRHSAAGDTYITAIVFLKLLARLEKRKVKTLGELCPR